MKSSIKTFTFLLLMFSLAGYAQKIDKEWKSLLNTNIESFRKCDQRSGNDTKFCSSATAESINKIYKIEDFYSKSQGRYMNNSEIVEVLNATGKWKLIGYAYEQEALDKAQELANKNMATLAYYANDDLSGNVSIILPGELSTSGSWGFNVPNSATFFMEEPGKSYSDKGLSYAFSRSILRKVMIYAREY
ncbi:MAG: hypothetical protein HC819_07265 [Cyclobacteriaceae bacterium]|nr:hypothetical protein [Cyclobacteriaceae bacterium]